MKFKKFLGAAVITALLSANLVASADFSNVSSYASEAVEAFEDMGIIDDIQLSGKTNAKRDDVTVWLVKSLDVKLVYPKVPTYKDVPASHPAYPYVETATNLGLIQGDTDKAGNLLHKFRPNSEVKRAELVKMIVTAYDLDLLNYSSSFFKDVEKGKWYYSYVQTAYDTHIINGFLNKNGSHTGTFGPSEKVNNQDAVVMMYRAWDMFGEDFDYKPTPQAYHLPTIDEVETVETVVSETVKPVEEPKVETSADWLTYNGFTSGLVEKFFAPEVAEVTEFDLMDGKTAMSIEFNENYLYGDRYANVDAIYLSQVEAAPGQTPFQKAQYDFEDLETWSSFLAVDNCELKNPVYKKLYGESQEIITVTLLVTCENHAWEEAVLAYAQVGNDGMFFAAFGNTDNNGEVVAEERIDYDGFVTDLLKMIQFRYRG